MLPHSRKSITSVVPQLFEIPAYYFNWVFQGKLYDSVLNSKQVSGWKWFWWVKFEPVIANAFILACFTSLFKCVLWWYCLFQDVKEKSWGGGRNCDQIKNSNFQRDFINWGQKTRAREQRENEWINSGGSQVP